MFGAAAAHLNNDAAAQQQAQLEAEAQQQQQQAGCSGAAAFSLDEDERQLDLVFVSAAKEAGAEMKLEADEPPLGLRRSVGARHLQQSGWCGR